MAAVRTPLAPRAPATLELAVSPDHDLTHEATLRRVGYLDIDLGEQEADAVSLEQCRFTRASLAGSVLDQATLTDCLVESSDWANLKATKSAMVRVKLATVRLTGLHWIDGALRDVTFVECRMDLATFRFTSFKVVSFIDCNLSRADFTGADLRGAQFTGCDLTGAQFAQANCAGARFARCDLSGVGTVTSLKGATITATDLVALSHTFAAALGITIEDA